MAIPSGSGTEVLKRATLHAAGAGWTEILSGTANHIYTIISLIGMDANGGGGTLNIRINDGSNDIQILGGQKVAVAGTFVWNDKFVMEGDDDLDIYASVAGYDWYLTYIDQDWT